MKPRELLKKCKEADECLLEDTYKSMIKRNLANPKDNDTFKLVSKILKIPFDAQGNAYIEYNNTTHNTYAFSNEYYSYCTEFQTKSVYENFKCLDKEDQKAVLYLTKSLFYNQTSPELFMHSEDLDEYL